MAGIVSFLESEQRTFEELALTSADSLVFTTLAYLNYDMVDKHPVGVSALLDPYGSERVSLHDVLTLCDHAVLAAESWMSDAKDTEPFFRALSSSRRYRDVTICYFVNEHSDIAEKQFSAITFFFQESAGETAFLSYRGTDGSLSGWKEDFNLCFKSVVPSQQTAVSYLSGVASAVDCPLYLGGHSKGGNLAEFAALVVNEECFERIKGVFNHDGPSFLDDPSPRIDEQRFLDVLHKTVPESSAFGMILEKRRDYRIVQSTALSFFQHVPFSWLVEDGEFVCQDELNKTAVFFDESIDTWLRGKTPEERERFIDTIYSLFVSTKASTLSEFQENLLANIAIFIDSGTKLDSETKDFVLKTFASLGEVMKATVWKSLKPAQFQWTAPRLASYRIASRKRLFENVAEAESTETQKVPDWLRSLQKTADRVREKAKQPDNRNSRPLTRTVDSKAGIDSC